jgi:hypothetical protein
MTGPATGDERNGSARELVVVCVTDTINPTLAGRGDVSYQSPPLPREEAQMLVRLLLGRSEEPSADEEGWTCPIAGGRRTVTLRPPPSVAECPHLRRRTSP